jgi:hypothetical protein
MHYRSYLDKIVQSNFQNPETRNEGHIKTDVIA